MARRVAAESRRIRAEPFARGFNLRQHARAFLWGAGVTSLLFAPVLLQFGGSEGSWDFWGGEWLRRAASVVTAAIGFHGIIGWQVRRGRPPLPAPLQRQTFWDWRIGPDSAPEAWDRWAVEILGSYADRWKAGAVAMPGVFKEQLASVSPGPQVRIVWWLLAKSGSLWFNVPRRMLLPLVLSHEELRLWLNRYRTTRDRGLQDLLVFTAKPLLILHALGAPGHQAFRALFPKRSEFTATLVTQVLPSIVGMAVGWWAGGTIELAMEDFLIEVGAPAISAAWAGMVIAPLVLLKTVSSILRVFNARSRGLAGASRKTWQGAFAAFLNSPFALFVFAIAAFASITIAGFDQMKEVDPWWYAHQYIRDHEFGPIVLGRFFGREYAPAAGRIFPAIVELTLANLLWRAWRSKPQTIRRGLARIAAVGFFVSNGVYFVRDALDRSPLQEFTFAAVAWSHWPSILPIAAAGAFALAGGFALAEGMILLQGVLGVAVRRAHRQRLPPDPLRIPWPSLAAWVVSAFFLHYLVGQSLPRINPDASTELQAVSRSTAGVQFQRSLQRLSDDDFSLVFAMSQEEDLYWSQLGQDGRLPAARGFDPGLEDRGRVEEGLRHLPRTISRQWLVQELRRRMTAWFAAVANEQLINAFDSVLSQVPDETLAGLLRQGISYQGLSAQIRLWLEALELRSIGWKERVVNEEKLRPVRKLLKDDIKGIIPFREPFPHAGFNAPDLLGKGA